MPIQLAYNNKMDKIEIAVELTKSIVLICQKVKTDFSSSVNQIFQSCPKPTPELPIKRFLLSSSKETKQSTSNEEPDLDQLQKYSKIFSIDSPAKIKKLKESSSSSSDESSEEMMYNPVAGFGLPAAQTPGKSEESIGLSKNSSSEKEDLGSEKGRKDSFNDQSSADISSITLFEQVIQYHKSTIASKSRLEEISIFISGYWKMGFKDRKFMRSILEKIEATKVDPEDKQAKAVFSEIQGKVRKVSSRQIFSESLFIEDWDNLYQTMKSAIKSKNNAKIEDSVKRAHNALPLELNEKMLEELAKFPKLFRKILKTCKGETEIKVLTLLKKISPKGNSSSKTTKNAELIAETYEFNNLNKKPINTVEANKTFKSRRSY